MRLLLDIGNTRLKWRLDDGGAGGHLSHEGRDWEAVLEAGPGAVAQVERVALASVAGAAATSAVRAWVTRRWPSATLHLARSEARGHGVINGYRRPERLGVDRWLAMIAARARLGLPVCVVDCGSAVTLDVVDDAGRHLGGAILAGLAVSRAALADLSPALRAEAADGEEFPARDTAAAIAQGTLRGLAGAVERLAGELTGGLDRPAAVVITGGDAGLLGPLLPAAWRVEPDLVLEGLALQSEGAT